MHTTLVVSEVFTFIISFILFILSFIILFISYIIYFNFITSYPYNNLWSKRTSFIFFLILELRSMTQRVWWLFQGWISCNYRTGILKQVFWLHAYPRCFPSLWLPIAISEKWLSKGFNTRECFFNYLSRNTLLPTVDHCIVTFWSWKWRDFEVICSKLFLGFSDHLYKYSHILTCVAHLGR